jgi:hypothetical protein
MKMKGHDGIFFVEKKKEPGDAMGANDGKDFHGFSETHFLANQPAVAFGQGSVHPKGLKRGRIPDCTIQKRLKQQLFL